MNDTMWGRVPALMLKLTLENVNISISMSSNNKYTEWELLGNTPDQN